MSSQIIEKKTYLYPYNTTPYEIECVREYNPLPSVKGDEPKLGVIMMVKNEKKRLLVSLESVKKYADALIMYDTGSTDDTMDIIKNFAEKHKINLFLIRGIFENFSASRNALLDYCDTINVDFLLLLDCNDELQNGDNFRKFLKIKHKEEYTGFLICQKWWSGQHDKYYNVRLVKNKSGWRYMGVVHEWFKDTTREGKDPAFPVWRTQDDDIILYQDRTQDDDKSSKRFKRDRELLIEENKKKPNDPRTIFYLAQTCENLCLFDEALYWSKIRTELKDFEEEVFHSYVRAGNCAHMLGQSWDDVLPWFMKALAHTPRIEPLIRMIEYYKNTDKWYVAYMYSRMAIDLKYPEHLILFVDNGGYNWTRWHLHSIVCSHVGKFEEGKTANLTAIKQGGNKPVDLDIKKFYEETEKKLKEEKSKEEIKKPEPIVGETRNQFLMRMTEELKLKYPKLPMKSVKSRADKLWKESKKK